MKTQTHGTNQAPNISAESFKRTKILATVGPATASYEMILKMIVAGVNGFRLNFSHANYEDSKVWIGWIRKAAKEYGKPVAVVQDLQGPKLRLGDFEGVIPVQPRKVIRLAYKADYEATGIIPLQYNLSKKVKRGERMLIADGRVRTIIKSVRDDVISTEIENEGVLTKRKGINLPDTDFSGDVLTKKDLRDIAFGCDNDVDYIALSFLQSASDVEKLRRILKNHNSDAHIIAKIETNLAVQNIRSIVRVSDVVMIARGDLAVETSLESVPVVARKIIQYCRDEGKASIMATEMLSSMTHSPQPTRAEMSDIASAVVVGADCLMLSDETAVGRYPIEAIAIMKRGILYTQQHLPLIPTLFKELDKTMPGAVASAVITLAQQVGARAIVAETQSGSTARVLSALRPSMPIIMITPSVRVAQQLAIVYGGKVFVRREHKEVTKNLTNWLHQSEVFKSGDILVSARGSAGMAGSTDTIKVYELQ